MQFYSVLCGILGMILQGFMPFYAILRYFMEFFERFFNFLFFHHRF
jgi:hypothetical protein